MATYDYKCKECEFEKEVSHSMKENPEITCDECEASMGKMIPKTLNFTLKGPSWSGKNAKEKNYRMHRKREMGQKMARSHDIPQIQPNYKGEVVNNWEDAKKLAKQDGVDANRYEKQVDNLQKQERKVNEKKKKLLKGEG
ncbi:zinc ribbon domain-containing protein [bacterium]|nr:zinc ribbon domain-containing protein [bacterium]